MLILAPIAAMLIQMAVSRTREYAADAAAAKYTGSPMGLVQALRKLDNWARRIPDGCLASDEPSVHLSSGTGRLGAAFLDAPFDGTTHRGAAGSQELREIRIGNRARHRLEAGHVWIYSSEFEIGQIGTADEAVLVRDPSGKLLGSALVDADSPIPLRLYSRKAEPFTESLLKLRLREAHEWRARVLKPGTEAYRMVFSEGDRLPGLVIDRYGSSYAVQIAARRYAAMEETLIEQLREEHNAGSIEWSKAGNDGWRGENLAWPTTRRMAYSGKWTCSRGKKPAHSWTKEKTTRALRNGRSNWGKQRAGGWTCLPTSVGFALHLAKQGMAVEAIDRSREALATLEANAGRNGIETIHTVPSDVKSYLYSGMQAKRRFDVIVVDPPAFAKAKQHREEGLRGYFEVNRGALRLLNGDGLIACFSCSHHVGSEELLQVVRAAAGETRKELRVLEKLEQSIDHAQLLQVPETHYLKGFVLQARTI